VFTAGGAALVFGSGLGNAVLHGTDYFAIRWLTWGFGPARMAKQFAGGDVIR
jgi:hypothetical protein